MTDSEMDKRGGRRKECSPHWDLSSQTLHFLLLTLPPLSTCMIPHYQQKTHAETWNLALSALFDDKLSFTLLFTNQKPLGKKLKAEWITMLSLQVSELKTLASVKQCLRPRISPLLQTKKKVSVIKEIMEASALIKITSTFCMPTAKHRLQFIYDGVEAKLEKVKDCFRQPIFVESESICQI